MNAIVLRGADLQQEVAKLDRQLAGRAEQFARALPSHITPEKFQRTVTTAVQANPDLLTCDRQSFLTACMKCAQDGLLPDGRESALVKFSTRQKVGNDWVSVALVQYMPMAFGLRKKILQSGEINDLHTGVVYRQEIERETFIYEEGTERQLRHKPLWLIDPTFEPADEDIVAAYSVATFKDGSKSFEVMSRSEINKIRQTSQTGATGKTKRDGTAIAPKGPWVDWFSEMARKSVMRRHSKTLPMSGDLLDVEARDDAEYARTSVQLLDSERPEEPRRLPSREETAGETIDQETGEIISSEDADAASLAADEAALRQMDQDTGQGAADHDTTDDNPPSGGKAPAAERPSTSHAPETAAAETSKPAERTEAAGKRTRSARPAENEKPADPPTVTLAMANALVLRIEEADSVMDVNSFASEAKGWPEDFATMVSDAMAARKRELANG